MKTTSKKRTFKKTMTDKALEANKNNAKKSTGPRTHRDIKTLQPNMKHGILAKIPVIPGIESQEEWNQFVIDLKLSLKPDGVLENTLVESLANYFWKKQRLVKYENNKIKYKVDNINEAANGNIKSYSQMLFKNPNDFVDKDQSRLDALKNDIKDFEDAQQAFIKFTDWPDDKDMEGNDAGLIVSCFLECIYSYKKSNGDEIPDTPFKLYDVETIIEDFWNPDKPATANQVVEIITKLAEVFGFDVGTLESGTRLYVDNTLKMLKKRTQTAEDSINELVNDELFDTFLSQKVMKLDAQLNRSIMQTLHELQRLQGMRVGLAGPPEAVDITGIDL